VRKDSLQILTDKRTACDVLEQMRKMDQTKNYSGLLAAIEELQEYYNLMEAGLWDSKRAAATCHSDILREKSFSAMKKLEKRWPYLKRCRKDAKKNKS